MKTIEGKYFDGLRPVAVPARMDFEDASALLVTDGLTLRYAPSELSVSPRITSAERFIGLPDGRQFLCRDEDFLETLPPESPTEGVVAWLENRSGVALAGVVVIVATLALGYFFGLPRLAQGLAARIPMASEQALGRQVLSWFDEEGWLQPSRLDSDRRQQIAQVFRHLHADLPLGDFYQLELRSGTLFGPNAFALPGGIIVLTDELVEVADSIDEVAAVLAHEIGHVEMRHAMRSVLQNSIIAAAVTAVTADAASIGAAVAGLPAVLAQTSYSREFENDADMFAFDLLKQKGRSPEAFAAIMTRLAAERGENAMGFNYLSTHPVTEERVQRALDAAR